jgi:hypothetical protein
MKHKLLKSMMAIAGMGAALMLTPAPSFGQEAPAGAPPADGRGGGRGGRGGRGGGGGGRAQLPPAGPVKHLADGHPDMSGYWNAGNNGGAVFDVEKHESRGAGFGAGNGAIVDPPDGMIPYQPWAREKANDNYTHHLAEEPELHCFQSGVPSQLYRQFGFQILQPAGYMVMNWEFMHAVRIIPTDNRPHALPETTKLFMGDSVGHWDGDTLVVDTTNLNDRTWMDTAGNFHSDQLHVVEKFTPVNDRTINYEATLEDSKVYTRPWKIAFPLNKSMQANYEIMEFACIEGNQDYQHYLDTAGGSAKAKAK